MRRMAQRLRIRNLMIKELLSNGSVRVGRRQISKNLSRVKVLGYISIHVIVCLLIGLPSNWESIIISILHAYWP